LHGKKRVEAAARVLVRVGWVVLKPTGYGLQVAFNPRETQAVAAFMRQFFPEV
jgi:hypothetical protein